MAFFSYLGSMSQQLERNKSILIKYIPEHSVNIIAEWIYRFDFKLKIKKSRTTKYGDYRPPSENTNHQITINHDLNKYAFLITLVHEIAHLSTWEKHKHTIKPHGEEWKKEFKLLMSNFMKEDIFPSDVIHALQNYLKNPAASSCSDLSLMRILKKYDKKEDVVFLETLPLNTVFKFNENRYFLKGEKIRTRYKCKEIKSQKIYLFNPLSEVNIVTAPLFPEN